MIMETDLASMMPRLEQRRDGSRREDTAEMDDFIQCIVGHQRPWKTLEV